MITPNGALRNCSCVFRPDGTIDPQIVKKVFMTPEESSFSCGGFGVPSSAFCFSHLRADMSKICRFFKHLLGSSEFLFVQIPGFQNNIADSEKRVSAVEDRIALLADVMKFRCRDYCGSCICFPSWGDAQTVVRLSTCYCDSKRLRFI